MDIRYKSMDTMRSIAILLVILAHTILSYGAPEKLAPLQLGGTGVDLFFLLSGWLLGGQLFKEINKTGNVEIKRFWIRRWMRTLPAYYAVLSLSIAQRYLTKENVEFPWEYFVFIQNYSYPLEFFSISWSLAVEEQFYLVIAPALCYLRFLGKKTTTFILVVAVLTPSIFRFLEIYEHPEETHVRLDCCVMGVLLSQIYHQYSDIWERLSKYAIPLLLISFLCYLFFYVARYYPGLGISDPSKLVLALIFGCWICAVNSDKRMQNIFYFPGSHYIATRSYSLYLLHPEALALCKRFLLDVPFVLYITIAFIISCAVAEILYRFLEKPIMDARENFSTSRQKVLTSQASRTP